MHTQPTVGLHSGNILVTGGNGFIGSHVVDYLKENGYHVTILDRYSKPHRNDVNFVLGDVRDRNLVMALAAEHQGIINLAAILGTSETVEHPKGTVHSNMLGALNVFDAAKQFSIRVTHITVGNYWMNNPYAITKNAAEKMALLYNEKFGTKISVVRGLNAYGERQKAAPVRKIIPNLVLPALRENPILIYGDGEQKMDMIYIKDLAKTLCLALTLDHNAWHTIFEAGSGDAPTVNEIARLVMNLTQSKSEIRHIAMRRGEPDRAVVKGYPETLAPLGLSSSHFMPLEDGLKKTVAYYSEHLDQF